MRSTASRLPINPWIKGGKAEPSFVIDVEKRIPLKIEQDIGQAAVMRVGSDDTWGIVGTKALQGFTKTAYGLIVKDGEARGVMIVGRPALVRGATRGGGMPLAFTVAALEAHKQAHRVSRAQEAAHA